jgi:hypothetical protein
MQCSGRSTAIRGRFSDGRPRDAGQQGRRGHGWAGRHDSEWPLAVAAPFIHTRAVCATANTTPPAATRLAVEPSRGASSTLRTDMILCAPLLQPRQAAAGPAAATPPSIPFASVNAACCFCRQHHRFGRDRRAAQCRSQFHAHQHGPVGGRSQHLHASSRHPVASWATTSPLLAASLRPVPLGANARARARSTAVSRMDWPTRRSRCGLLIKGACSRGKPWPMLPVPW